jgi:hypothetical protein
LTNNNALSQAIGTTTWVWRPKQAQEPKPKEPPTTKKIMQVWKVKHAISTKTPYIVEATSNIKEQSKPYKMCLQALDLQLKLFGRTSVLLPRTRWLDFVQKQQGYKKLEAIPYSLMKSPTKVCAQDLNIYA